MRGPIVVAMVLLIGLTYYNVTWFLIKGVITTFGEFFLLLLGTTFPMAVIILREGMAESVSRTIQICVDDMPGIVADGFVPGQIVKDVQFHGTDEEKGDPFDQTRFFEAAWGGPVKRWPFRGRGPVFFLLCQYNLNDPNKTPQAGFMQGPRYIVPLKADCYRMDWLKETRDPRYAEIIQAIPEFGRRVHKRTWIVLATRPVPLPDRAEIKGPTVDNMELWHERRLRRKAYKLIHEHGVDERVTDRLGMRK